MIGSLGFAVRPILAAMRFDAMTENERPRYVAIITDGNGRWAEEQGYRGSRTPGGHGERAGTENVRARLRDVVELGIRELTVYAFSTRTGTRSPEEVAGCSPSTSTR